MNRIMQARAEQRVFRKMAYEMQELAIQTDCPIYLGDKEIESNTISVRDRQNNQKNAINLDDFIANVKEIDATKSLNLWK